MDIAELGFKVDFQQADKASKSLDGLERSADKAGAGLDDMARKAKTAESAAEKLAGKVGLLRGSMLAMAAGMFGGMFAKVSGDMSDLEARLTRTTGSIDAAREAMGRLHRVSLYTSTAFEQTVETFLNMQQSLDGLGYNVKQSLEFVEALNYSLDASAIKGQRAETVLYALQKAMALGVLRGVELNTVIATGGRVVTLLAEQMGVAVNELRRLGSEGKITSEILYEALAGNLDKVRAESEAMAPTIADALGRVSNQLKKVIYDLDSATGVSHGISDAIVLLADNIKLATIAVVAFGAAVALHFSAQMLALLAARIGAVVVAIKAMAVALMANPYALLAGAIAGALAYLALFRDEIKVSADGIATLGDFAGAAKTEIGLLAQSFGLVRKESKGTADAVVKNIEDQRSAIVKLARLIATTVDALEATIKGFALGVSRTVGAMVEKVGEDLSDLGRMLWMGIKRDKAGLDALVKDIAGRDGLSISGIFDKAFLDAQNEQASSGYTAFLDRIIERAHATAIERLKANKGAAIDPTDIIDIDPGKYAAALNAVLGAISIVADQEKAMLDERGRLIELANSKGLMSIEQYYEAQRRLVDDTASAQVREIDNQIAAYRKFGMAGDERAATELKIAKLLEEREQAQRSASISGLELAFKEQQAQERLGQAIAEVNIRLMELSGNLAGAARLRSQMSTADTRKLLEANGISTEGIDRLEEYEVAQARIAQFQEKQSMLLEDLRIKEQQINLDRELGAASELASLKMVGDARRVAHEQLLAQIEEYNKLAEGGGLTDRQLQDLDRMRIKAKELEAVMDPLAQKFQTIYVNSFADAFSGFISGAMSASEAIKSFADTVVQQISRIIAQEIALKAVKGVAGALGASFDGGGYTGSGPRSGGLDGKGGFLAVMHPQETVIDHTKGQQAGGNTKIINVLDPSVVGDYMRTADGEQLVVNIMQRNKQVVGV